MISKTKHSLERARARASISGDGTKKDDNHSFVCPLTSPNTVIRVAKRLATMYALERQLQNHELGYL